MLIESNNNAPSLEQEQQQRPQLTRGAKIAIIASAVVILALLVCIYIMVDRAKTAEEQLLEAQNNLAATEEMMKFEKEKLADEYAKLVNQYDGMLEDSIEMPKPNEKNQKLDKKLQAKNDELQKKLEKEQEHVKQLLQELKNTKATDAAHIAELRAELETSRGIMADLVRQIDALQRENATLRSENEAYRVVNEQLREDRKQLKDQKAALDAKVARAALMKVNGFSVEKYNRNDKEAKRLAQITKFKFNVNVMENVTASTGNKTIYMQLRRPDGELMTGAGSGTFTYEGAEQTYSMCKTFEYGGQDTPVSMYWTVGEELEKGTYRVEYFLGGNMVGSFTFALEK